MYQQPAESNMKLSKVVRKLMADYIVNLLLHEQYHCLDNRIRDINLLNRIQDDTDQTTYALLTVWALQGLSVEDMYILLTKPKN